MNNSRLAERMAMGRVIRNMSTLFRRGLPFQSEKPRRAIFCLAIDSYTAIVYRHVYVDTALDMPQRQKSREMFASVYLA